MPTPALTSGIGRLPGLDATVTVEAVLLRRTAGDSIAYRTIRVRRAPGTAPDQVALTAAGLDGSDRGASGTVSHSTCWRYDGAEDFVLTYAIAPDPDLAQPAQSLPAAGVVCSADPLHPQPDALHEHHVVAHAVRHLSYLAATDPTVAAAAAAQPQLWLALRRYSAQAQVGLHRRLPPHDEQPAPIRAYCLECAVAQ